MTQTTTYNAYELARMAECMSPDSLDSPGAQFLLRIQDDYNEAVEEDYWNEDETPHEIADNAVPVYTHQMWLTFVDLGAYQEDPSELGYENDDMDKAGSACLYLIAQRLVYALAKDEA